MKARPGLFRQGKGIGIKFGLVWLGSFLGMVAPASAAASGKCTTRAADALVRARYPNCKSKALLSYLHNNLITPFSFQCGKTIQAVCREENCAKPESEAERARCQGRYVAVLSECRDELEGAAKMAVCKETADWPVTAIQKPVPVADTQKPVPVADTQKSVPVADTPKTEPVAIIPKAIPNAAVPEAEAKNAAVAESARPDLPGMDADPVPPALPVTPATLASEPIAPTVPAAVPASIRPLAPPFPAHVDSVPTAHPRKPAASSRAPAAPTATAAAEPVEYGEVLVFDPDTGETVAVRKPRRRVNRIRLLPRERPSAR